MPASNMGSSSRSASVDLPGKKASGNCGPMCQQSPLGAHGHEMYPQEFIRLVGCSDKPKEKVDKIEHLH
jgi:hypothetical protein